MKTLTAFFRYSYDPFQQSLNDNPEYELPLSAGDYVLGWGDVDDVRTYSSRFRFSIAL